MWKYTRNEWRRRETTLAPHLTSEFFWFFRFSIPNIKYKFSKNTNEIQFQRIRVTQEALNITEVIFDKSSPLVSSVVSHLPHSFRVRIFNLPFRYQMSRTHLRSKRWILRVHQVIFHTRFECSFTPSPPVSSVFFQKLSQYPNFQWTFTMEMTW